MIIVIDGPAGSGKSSTARAVADRLNIEYLDSGALYRTATLMYIEAGRDKEEFFTLLNQKEISFYYRDHRFHVAIDGTPVTNRIRKPEVSRQVSQVAAMPKVRDYINELMHGAVEEGIYIAEGRDLGSVVFPDAELKFFMWADLEERARRRYEEQKEDHPELTLRDVKENIAERDQKDSQRKAAPLMKADDAIELNTTSLTFEQQVEKICSIIEEHIDIE